MADYDPAGPATYDDTPDEGFQDGESQFDEQQSGEEDEDYDPSSFAFDDSANAAQQDSEQAVTDSAPPIQAGQASAPKTLGGFVVDDDEDEEEQEQSNAVVDPPPASLLNGTEDAQSGLGAVAVSEAKDISVASEAPQDTAAVDQTAPQSAVHLNGSDDVSASVPDPAASASVTTSNLTVPAPSLPSPDQGKQQASPSAAASAVPSATATPQPATTTNASPRTNGAVPATPTTTRLPHDKVGQLEDRIREDPKADTDAWRTLITHYREKGQLDQARKVYQRFFEVFPSAGTMWIENAQMELEVDDRRRVEEIFNQALSKLQLPVVDLCNMYLDYLRRVHPLINDPDGSKRTIIIQAFEWLLSHVGIDPDAGKVWREYVDFVKSGPGVVGGTGWQDLQKADDLRRAYQRAIKLPHSELTKLWKEYDNFEQSLNKANARKYMQEQGMHYMTARTARNQLDQRIEGLDRTSLPKLPPLHGFAGDDEFATQVEKWRAWIEWEKEDPLVFKDDEIETYQHRVIYAYRQANMQLRFYPEIWFESANWCFDQGTEKMTKQGDEFLDQGIGACPESVLLALKKADRIESNLEAGNSDEVAIRNGALLDVPFETVHTALYALHKKVQERTNKAVAQIQEYFASLPPEEEPEVEVDEEDRDEDSQTEKPKTRTEQMRDQIKATRDTAAQHLDVLKRTISYVWVAKLRAFRRTQGQGQPGKPKKGFRGVFAEARPRGQLTSEVYIANALMEWHCYKDKSAEKIFERGLKLFPLDEVFALEYIKHLVSNGDDTNARAVFETFLTKIMTPPRDNEKEKGKEALSIDTQRQKARPLMAYMHEIESNYGDLEKVHKLEKRMKDLFPDEPDVNRFGNRFALPSFDALQVQLVISLTQAQPKMGYPAAQHQPQAVPSIEQPLMRSPPEASNIRLGPNGPYISSPKRALEDSDTDSPQRKFMRGESPLKGAAGRRMQNQSISITGPQIGGAAAGSGFMTKTYTPNVPPPATGVIGGAVGGYATPAPAPFPPGVGYLLSILPHASSYRSTMFDPGKMVEFLRSVNLQGARI